MPKQLPYLLKIHSINALISIVLIVNIFVWYSCATTILIDKVDKASFTFNEKLMVYIIGIVGAVLSILIGACFASKFKTRKYFLFMWTLIGIVSSIFFITLEVTTLINISILTFAVNISFGLGLPVSLACFAESTIEENRGRFAMITLLAMFFTAYALNSLMSESIIMNSSLLAFWRILGLLGVFISKNSVVPSVSANPSLTSILRERSFILYMVPWTLFSMVNYLGWPIGARMVGEDFVYFCASMGSLIAAIFSIIAGFATDSIGRKRTLIIGFVIFGLGYGILGIYPSSTLAWYFYTFVDGIAWGIIFVIFWFTIWGDLAYKKRSEKYYALGILPYSFSGFLRVTVGPFIANIISEYAIFSFAALFLFLSVIPLMYAPETLPEKTLKERELKSYIEKAKKIKEKFT